MTVLHATVFADSQPLAIFAQLLQAVLFGLVRLQASRRPFVHCDKRAMASGIFFSLFVAMLFGLCKKYSGLRHGDHDEKQKPHITRSLVFVKRRFGRPAKPELAPQ
jgi:hypothetical protein